MGSKKIRIFHLIASNGIGGAERILLNLSKNIDREKFDLVLGIFVDQKKSPDFFLREAEKLGFPLETIEYKNPYNLLQILQLYRIFKKHHPDIIHTHGYKPNILGFLVAKLFEVPIMTTVHGLHSGRDNRLIWFGLKLLTLFDRIIVVSDQIKRELKTMKVPPGKLITIRNVPPIETKENWATANTFREEIGIPPNAKLIGFVGRLEPIKGCSLFIRSIPRVIKSNLDSYFVVVGDGVERKSLESLARELGIENRVYFCGFRDDPMNIFQSLDLYVLPSLSEGIPLAMLEAMSTGVPVVATSVGGIPEVIQDKVNGLLVPLQDPVALAEGILETLNNSNETAKRVVEAKNTIINEFNQGKWIERVENIYLEMKGSS
jgi:glycosyltransferase involved in cell wall biosynthesis